MKELGLPDLTYVDSLADAEAFLSWLGERRPVLAIDTETTGLEWWTPHFTRLVQFGDGQRGWALSVRDWRGVIAEAMRRVHESGVPVVMHNAKFDTHALEVEGLALPNQRTAHDTYIMHHLFDSSADHSLKGILGRMYGDGATVGDRMLKLRFAETKTWWDTIPTDDVIYWSYAALDTVLTARLAEDLWPAMQHQRHIYDREMAVLWLMYGAEKRGMHVDTTYAELLMNGWLLQAADLADGLERDGIKNPRSNKQISDVLETLGWEPDEFTPTGAVKLDKVILNQLASIFPGDIAGRILTLRRLLKWSKAYLEPFATAAGGIVHPSIRTLGARHGRESVSGPPLQQLPSKGDGGKLIRTAVLPHGEPGEQVLYAVDYDGQELRFGSHFMRSSRMIQAFREGLDPHKFAAGLALGKATEEVTKDEKAPFKNYRYGKFYGAGDPKLAVTAGIPLEEVQRIGAIFDELFPEEKAYMRELEGLMKERWADDGRPWVETWGGRKVMVDSDKLYTALNYKISGTAADLLKVKKIALHAAGLADYIVIPVHDEIVFSFPKEEAADMAHEAATIMQELDEFSVPITVSVTGPLDNWGEAYGADD